MHDNCVDTSHKKGPMSMSQEKNRPATEKSSEPDVKKSARLYQEKDSDADPDMLKK